MVLSGEGSKQVTRGSPTPSAATPEQMHWPSLGAAWKQRQGPSPGADGSALQPADGLLPHVARTSPGSTGLLYKCVRMNSNTMIPVRPLRRDTD